jgi:hypothetical protein
MKAIYPILIGFAIACPSRGQDSSDDSALAVKVQKAIEKFNSRTSQDDKTGKEVVVVLPPPEPEPQAAEEEAAIAKPVEEDPVEVGQEIPGEEPKPVTGNPPAEKSNGQPEANLETAPVEKEGLGIRVESIREGSGELDQGQIKLKASFPAKSLSTAPNGWILEKSEQAPALQKEVTLRPGKTISLTIRPHVLAPASDGINTFAVIESGFDVSEGYRQSNTVSAVLGNSVAQLDRDALLLGNAISNLHQLLASLPKPEPEDSPQP